MSGAITRSSIPPISTPLAAQRRPCQTQIVSLSATPELFADDKFQSKSTQNRPEEQDKRRGIFNRRRNRYFFRWREARNFFRRMLFLPHEQVDQKQNKTP